MWPTPSGDRSESGRSYSPGSDAEWDEFEQHFVKRKVSLGTCGRAYGTPCSHEHACVRCGLLRVDPAQHERLVTIRDNLTERISEATDRGWLGEVEGLQVSLAAATAKLTKLVAQPATARPENARTVLLGPPSPANK